MRQLLLFVFGVFFSSVVIAQSSDNKNTAVCYFLATMSEDLGVSMSEALSDSVYAHLTTFLSDSAHFTFKDKSTLLELSPFQTFGYPLISGKRAAKSKAADYYLKIVVDINPAGFATTNSSSISAGGNVGIGKKKTNAKVKVVISAVLYDKKGARLKRVTGKAISADKIQITQNMVSLGGFTQTDVNEDITQMQAFYAVLDEAVANLVQEFNK